MQTIASLTGPDFLRACNKTRHAVEDFLRETDLAKIRRRLPVIPEGASEDERRELLEAQGRENVRCMLDVALDENAEATYRLLQTLIIAEPGEELDGFDLLSAALDLVSSPKMLDFFTRSAKLAQTITAE